MIVTNNTDTNKKRGTILSVSTNSFLRKENTLFHTTDTHKKKPIARTFTTDANKRDVTTIVHTADANKKRQILRLHTADVYKTDAKVLAFTTNANKRKSISITFTSDIIKRTSNIRIFSTSANFLKDPYVHQSTDAKLWKMTDSVRHKNAPVLMDIGNGLSTAVGNLRISTWNTAGRPTNPRYGTFGFNFETGNLEYWNGSNWMKSDT